MTAVIARVRRLIADTNGVAFDDDAVQEALDAQRQDVRYGELNFDLNQVAISGKYLDYFAEVGDWEGGAALYRYGSTTPLTTATADLAVGRWTFAASTYPPVYIVGQTFDVYRASADLLDQWAATLKLQYSATIDGQTYNRGDRLVALDKLAEKYRRKARPRTLHAERSDVNASDWLGGGLPVPYGARSR